MPSTWLLVFQYNVHHFSIFYVISVFNNNWAPYIVCLPSCLKLSVFSNSIHNCSQISVKIWMNLYTWRLWEYIRSPWLKVVFQLGSMSVFTVITPPVLSCRYAYSRLKWLGSRLLSFAVTMMFLSLWHGLWPGYFLCFFHELVSIQAEREVSCRPDLRKGLKYKYRILSAVPVGMKW